jgi:chemotaxis protein methyltransferase CheR
LTSAPSASADTTVTGPPNIAEVIRERFGIVLSNQQRDALQQLALENISDVSTAPLRDIAQLLGAITVPESYFFRDSVQMNTLRERVLPMLISAARLRPGPLRLRVWSAAASGGQELRTIAILLHELLPDFDHWNLELVGTDLNAEQVHRARRAEYTARDLRSTPAHIKEHYFDKQSGIYTVKNGLSDDCSFRQANLLDPDTYRTTNEMDLILCRNVLIYFSPEANKQASDYLAGSLGEHGVLMLGHAEIRSDPPPGLFLDHHHQVYYYSREVPKTSARDGAADVPAVGIDTPNKTRSNRRVSQNRPAPNQRGRIEPQPLVPLHPLESALSTPIADADDRLNQLAALNTQEDWVGLLDEVNSEMNPSAVESCYQVLAYLGLGEDNQARSVLDELIRDHADSPEVHYLAGLIHESNGNLATSVGSFRLALYLRPNFPEAHLRLGLARSTSKDTSRARKDFQQALKQVSNRDPTEPALFDVHLRYGDLDTWLQTILASGVGIGRVGSKRDGKSRG